MGKQEETSDEEPKGSKGTTPSGYAMHDDTSKDLPSKGHEPSGYATYE